jgi:excisionase family DNA binding protein
MDTLINLAQASRIMGCSYSKAQKLAKSGELPFRKLGATWVIPRSALCRELGLEEPCKEKRKGCA